MLILGDKDTSVKLPHSGDIGEGGDIRLSPDKNCSHFSTANDGSLLSLGFAILESQNN